MEDEVVAFLQTPAEQESDQEAWEDLESQEHHDAVLPADVSSSSPLVITTSLEQADSQEERERIEDLEKNDVDT